MGEKKLRYNEIYISPEDKEKIKNLYLSGSSTVKIGQLQKKHKIKFQMKLKIILKNYQNM